MYPVYWGTRMVTTIHERHSRGRGDLDLYCWRLADHEQVVLLSGMEEGPRSADQRRTHGEGKCTGCTSDEYAVRSC